MKVEYLGIDYWVGNVVAHSRGLIRGPNKQAGTLMVGPRGMALNGAMFAWIIRQEPLLVGVGVPGIGNLRYMRHLYRTLQRRGVPFVVLPERTMTRAGIPSGSVEVLGSRRHTLWGVPYVETVFTATSELFATRPARFLAGYDFREFFPSYFLCELPPSSTATTVAQAYEDLKPGAVKQAEQVRRVKRQGDIFAIPLPSFSPDERDAHACRVLGTNHYSEQTVHQNGLTYARGKLLHHPVGRRPDHRSVWLGKTWHLLLKNTVPVVRR